MRRPKHIFAIALLTATPALAGSISTESAAKVGLRPHWAVDLVMPKRQGVAHLHVLDDNAYAVTDHNFAFAVHGGTGVLRWTAQIAKPGQRLLGPVHNGGLAYFTSQMGVHTFHRQTGRPADETRLLSGVIIEAAHDIATINLGMLHGVELGTVLPVYKIAERGSRRGEHIANLRVTVVKERQSQARVTRLSPTNHPDSGDVVEGEVKIPNPLVSLPFAPSSPAISEGEHLYYGASNNRVYRVRARDGIVAWEFGSTAPVSAMPRLHKGRLYIAGQDGKVVCCEARDKMSEWTFASEAPIFSTPWVDDSGVYVASTDRYLYGLDLARGTRRWRQQFNTPDIGSPTVVGGTVYVNVPGDGFYAFAAESGKQLWKVEAPAHYLAIDGDTLYLRIGGGMDPSGMGVQSIRTVDRKTGQTIGAFSTAPFEFVGAVSNPVTIILADGRGHVECLRSRSSPHLRPTELAQVLADDEAARLQAPRKGAPATRPALKAMGAGEDPFTSKSGTEPVGGHGLVGPGAGSKPASQPGSEEAGEGESSGDEAGDKADGEKSGEDKADEDKSDDESGDDADKDDADGDKSDDDANSNGTDDDANTNGSDDDANSNNTDDDADTNSSTR